MPMIICLFSFSVARGRPKNSTKEKNLSQKQENTSEESQTNAQQQEQSSVSTSQTQSQSLPSNSEPIAGPSIAASQQVSTVQVTTTKVPSGHIRTASSYWTEAEKKLFLHHLQINGKDWNYLSEQIPTKTIAQIKNYYQNYRVKLGLEKLLPEKSLQKSRRGRR